MEPAQEIEAANLSKRDQRTGIRDDDHSNSFALGNFRLPLVFSKPEIWNSQLRCAPDEIETLQPQELGCFAAGNQASPVQFQDNHFSRRLLDRLAELLQHGTKLLAQIQVYRSHKYLLCCNGTAAKPALA
jgi:hypothetical protein